MIQLGSQLTQILFYGYSFQRTHFINTPPTLQNSPNLPPLPPLLTTALHSQPALIPSPIQRTSLVNAIPAIFHALLPQRTRVINAYRQSSLNQLLAITLISKPSKPPTLHHLQSSISTYSSRLNPHKQQWNQLNQQRNQGNSKSLILLAIFYHIDYKVL